MDSVVILVTAVASLATLGVTAVYWTGQDANTTTGDLSHPDEHDPTDSNVQERKVKILNDKDSDDDYLDDIASDDGNIEHLRLCLLVKSKAGALRQEKSGEFLVVNKKVVALMIPYLQALTVACEDCEVAPLIAAAQVHVPEDWQALYNVFQNFASAKEEGHLERENTQEDLTEMYVQLARLNVANISKLLNDGNLWKTDILPGDLLMIIVKLVSQHLKAFCEAVSRKAVVVPPDELAPLAKNLLSICTQLKDKKETALLELAAVSKELADMLAPLTVAHEGPIAGPKTCAATLKEVLARDHMSVTDLGPLQNCVMNVLLEDNRLDVLTELEKATDDTLRARPPLLLLKNLLSIEKATQQDATSRPEIEAMLQQIQGTLPAATTTEEESACLEEYVAFLNMLLMPFVYAIVLTSTDISYKENLEELVTSNMDDEGIIALGDSDLVFDLLEAAPADNDFLQAVKGCFTIKRLLEAAPVDEVEVASSLAIVDDNKAVFPPEVYARLVTYLGNLFSSKLDVLSDDLKDLIKVRLATTT